LPGVEIWQANGGRVNRRRDVSQCALNVASVTKKSQATRLPIDVTGADECNARRELRDRICRDVRFRIEKLARLRDSNRKVH
jgi:hypothetical protein